MDFFLLQWTENQEIEGLCKRRYGDIILAMEVGQRGV